MKKLIACSLLLFFALTSSFAQGGKNFSREQPKFFSDQIDGMQMLDKVIAEAKSKPVIIKFESGNMMMMEQRRDYGSSIPVPKSLETYYQAKKIGYYGLKKEGNPAICQKYPFLCPKEDAFILIHKGKSEIIDLADIDAYID